MLKIAEESRSSTREVLSTVNELGARLNRTERKTSQLITRVNKLEGKTEDLAEDTGRYEIELLQRQLKEREDQLAKHERQAEKISIRAHEAKTWWTRWGAEGLRSLVIAGVAALFTWLATRGH